MQHADSATRQVVAHNDAADSGNPMHDEAAARALNFKGALVPGVTVYGYMTHSLVSHFGESWLSNGCLQVRFRRPVYVGDKLDVVCAEQAHQSGARVVDMQVLNQDHEVCALGQATLGADDSVVRSFALLGIAPARDLPAPKWPAEREYFAREKILGTFFNAFATDDVAEFVAAMQDDQPIYRTGVVHPAWLLRQANLVVDRNFDLGPWIHVQSEIRNYAMAQTDTPIAVRAQVMDLFEKNGHEYFDLDVVLLANDDPRQVIMRVVHRAIYKVHSAT